MNTFYYQGNHHGSGTHQRTYAYQPHAYQRIHQSTYIVFALFWVMAYLTFGWAQNASVTPDMPAYELELTLANDLASLQAEQTVTFTNTSQQMWEGVYFYLYPNLLGGEMIVHEVRQAGLPLEVTFNDGDDDGGSLMYVPVLGGLAPSQQTTLQLRYDLTIPQRMGRNYGVLALQEGILSLAHSYATLAIFEDDWIIDLPVSHGDLLNAATSTFAVTVRAPAEVAVVTTGEVITSVSDGTTQQLEIIAAPARDFYLSASRDYDVITATANITDANMTPASTTPVIVRSYYQRTVNEAQNDTRRQRAQLALEAAVVSLELFSTRLTPYPYPEFDIVPMVTTALGLEFPGIIGLSSALYEDTRIGRQASLYYLESTVVHEVVHQWFYNLVGNDQVGEPWLDEAITQYVTWEYFKNRYGDRSSEAEDFAASLVGRSRSGTQQKLAQPVAAYSPVQYSAVIYGVGPLVVADLAALVGEEVFWRFLRNYSHDNRWQRVDTDAFEKQLEAYCDCVLDEFFETYIR